MTADLSTSVLVALGLIGLCGGIGITTLGPGGVLPTVGLFVLTGLSPAEVAGTAIVTHVATGALATAAYTRSGQLREPATRRTALLLAGTAVLGTPVGVLLNTEVSQRAFGFVLGLFVAAAAVLVWYREHCRPPVTPPSHPSATVVAGLGLAVSAASGLVGIGGPMLTVPLLVALGVPVLESLASAQARRSSSPTSERWDTSPTAPSTGPSRRWSASRNWPECCWAGRSPDHFPPTD
ncbi:sulfite exporter TauE/SafE family protein [Streptomyces sp. NPDC004069]